MTLALLPLTVEIHVLSVRNECKELLFVMERGAESAPFAGDPMIECVDFRPDGSASHFAYRLSEESSAAVVYAPSVDTFLYEPNASILKAGAFKRVAVRFGLNPLQVNSHLYASAHCQENFPGRVFRVDEVLPFSGKLLKTLKRQIPKANISTRNFPLSVNELRSRTGIVDGGDIYLFATTLSDGAKVLIRTSKVLP